MGDDFLIVIRWWGTLFFIGTFAYPLTKRLFNRWFDHGYLFAKAVGMALVTYVVYLTGVLHILPFTKLSIVIALALTCIAGLVLEFIQFESGTRSEKPAEKITIHGSIITIKWRMLGIKRVLILVAEEMFFFGALLLWSWVKGHEPSIHGLEKFMDYGFTQSILNSRYFPASDMWYTGLPINYYYFGHTVMAVVTKLSGIDLAYTFNLMLATIFALTLTMSFSIAYQVTGAIRGIGKRIRLCGAVFISYILTLGGNLQTLYAFTKGYTGDNVQPFWNLLWPISQFWQKLPEGMERYWYANATRFIPYTIHEFPGYSFVVSDVHGHVLSIPFVLLAIAILVAMFGSSVEKDTNHELRITNYGWIRLGFYGLLVAILLMTNASDGPIYFGLFFILFVIFNWAHISQWRKYWKQVAIPVILVLGTAILTSIPFLLYFKSFVSGVAVNCPLVPLAGSNIGPIFFEGIEKCQHSPIWMMLLLWGFFLYCGAWFIGNIVRSRKEITQLEIVLFVFFLFSLALIIFPEFLYFKDIYPMHFRSNTMFKLGYQAFMIFSFVSGYTIISFLKEAKKVKRIVFFLFLLPLVFLVGMYPYFSVRSYFGNLQTYQGLYGLTWLAQQYPDDYAGIVWLNKEIEQQGSPSTSLRTTMTDNPVIVEADGDSYTDYARFSAFTGLPTIIGWPVHEWLWRGSYDIVAPRREEVRVIYESDDKKKTREILTKYNVQYIVIGALERKKFTLLRQSKIATLGDLVFHQGGTEIYKVYNP